jgi:hypothetical protein
MGPGLRHQLPPTNFIDIGRSEIRANARFDSKC